MELQHKQIETIANNVQNILDNELQSISKFKELENKFNNLQNAIFSPFNSPACNPEEEKAFGDYLRKGTASEFITKSLSTATGEAGVVIVNNLNNKIVTAVNAKSVMRQLASIETISSSALDSIIEDGKFTSGWIGEAQAREVTDTPKLKKKTISAHELYAQPKATQKLIDDSAIDINSWLAERLADSFIKAENEAFITGDGDKKPFGILTNEDVERIDATATVTPDILLKLINALDEEHIANASFLMSRSTLASIQGLKDENGRFIWQQSLSEPLKQTIFGIPVFCSSHMPNVGENNLAIAIGDFKVAYKIVDRAGIGIIRDPYTDKPFIKFYAVKRVGGDVIVPSALKFAKFSA
jgi:HK97 family phage major capsid protein